MALRAEHALDGPAEQRGGGRVVDDRRHAALVGDLRGRRRTARRSASISCADQVLGVGPGDRVEHPDGAGRRRRRAGMTLGAEPARTMPHTTLTPGARVEAAAQDRGQLGDDLAEGEGEVLGQVRARGVAALAGRAGRSSASAAPVSGPSRRPTRPTSRLGSQCRPKIVVDAVEGAGLDQVQRAAGHDLLGGLEEQPHPAGQQAARGAPRPARGRRRPGRRCARRGRRRGRRRARCSLHGSVVRSSTGSASRSARSATRRPAVADLGDARPPPSEPGDRPARLPRARVDDRVGGAVLGPGQLGVGVQVATQATSSSAYLSTTSVDDGRRREVGHEVQAS